MDAAHDDAESRGSSHARPGTPGEDVQYTLQPEYVGLENLLSFSAGEVRPGDKSDLEPSVVTIASRTRRIGGTDAVQSSLNQRRALDRLAEAETNADHRERDAAQSDRRVRDQQPRHRGPHLGQGLHLPYLV